MANDSPIDVLQPYDSQRPSTWRVIIAPWIYMFRPSKAAETMVNARTSSFATSYLCGCVVFCGVFLLFAFFTKIIERLGDSIQVLYLTDLYLTAHETWSYWANDGVWLKCIVNAVLLCAGTIVLNVFLAWLLWPSLITADSETSSYGHTFRCTAAALGLVSSLVLALIIVPTSYVYGRLWIGPRTPYWLMYHFPVIFPSQVLVSVHLLLCWLRRAGNPLDASTNPIELSSMCEGCGYDLTHRSSGGKCTECGLALDESLLSEKRRTGCVWELPFRSRFIPYIKTTVGCLRNLETFYGSLKLRTSGEQAMKFITWHLAMLGLTCAIWIFLAQVWLSRNPNYLSAIYMSFVMLLLTPLLGWIGIHFVGAVVTTWYMAHTMLPNPSVVRKVLAYETSVLWLFFIFTAILLTTYFAYGDWVSLFFGRDFFLGMPMDLFMIFFGYVLLAIMSFRRFHRALLAVRWANF